MSDESTFTEFIRDTLPQKQTEAKAPAKTEPAEKVLDWLLDKWQKPTISARELYTHGPSFIRNRKNAVSLAEALVRAGQLVPIEVHQNNMRKWQIAKYATGITQKAHAEVVFFERKNA